MDKCVFHEAIHAPNRLKICAYLAPLEIAEFQSIRTELAVSDSVLSKHLKQLEQLGYISLIKGSENGRKKSWVTLTRIGRKAFIEHSNELRRIMTLGA